MNSAQSQFDVLLSYAAPAGGRLTDEMLDIYDKAGVILLRDFVSTKTCKAPRERTLELVEQFDPAEVQGVFSTTKQTRLDDSYFIDSGTNCNPCLRMDPASEVDKMRNRTTVECPLWIKSSRSYQIK